MLTHPDEETARPGSASDSWHLSFTLNGVPVEADVSPFTSLLDVLRLHLGQTGSKGACLEGECGSCTVLVNGVPQNSCLILAPQAEGLDITSVEGLASGETLHQIQQAFLDCGAVQCGYCTPGLLISARAYLAACDHVPTTDEVRRGLEGNICRCTGYTKVIDAVIQAARTTCGSEGGDPA